jgi:hypothetical protein
VSRVVSRTLGRARADIGNVVFERLPALNTMVVATENGRAKAQNGTQPEHDDQRFPSHLVSPCAVTSRRIQSARRTETASEGSGLDQVRQDLALPIVERFVDLGECGERAAARAVDQLVVARKHAVDRRAIQTRAADGASDLRARASKFAARAVQFVQQRVHGLTYHFFLTWGRIEPVKHTIQHKPAPTEAKPSAPLLSAALPAVMTVAGHGRS